jgi:lysine 2,3-aminomutase
MTSNAISIPFAGDDARPGSARVPVAASALMYRDFDDSEFWRSIPAYATVDRVTFMDHAFQSRRSVTRVDQLREVLGSRVTSEFLDDLRKGAERAWMNLRISPYLLARIDWSDPWDDPICIQFFPLASRQLPDHPLSRLDALSERANSPVPGLVHRYADRALFLPLDVCPVYCRFCTRSYVVGGDTLSLGKARLKPDWQRWQAAIDYIASRAEIEDVLISGGDAFLLPAQHLCALGRELLAIDQVRRIRVATRGPAVMPMKLLSDRAWTDGLIQLASDARTEGKEVCLHTHFNHPAEISAITRDAMLMLYREGLTVRNQTVLIRGVNDRADVLTELVKRLGFLQVRPYYVHQHDLVASRSCARRWPPAARSSVICAARRPVSIRRPSCSIAPAAAASAISIPTIITIA